MYITIWKVYRDRLGFNQVVSKPVTDTTENRAARNGTYHTYIARRGWRSGQEGRVLIWTYF